LTLPAFSVPLLRAARWRAAGWHDVRMRGRSKTDWWGVVLEAPDGPALAAFYSRLFGWDIAREEPDGAAIQVPGTSSYLAFQSAADYVLPVWPAAGGRQQMMMHIDVAVDDLDAAVEAAVELGATVHAHQPQDDVRVLLDPAGHPFCLYLDIE
jgi:predicted enzyme related to lactoylglutathione lyase